MKKGGVIIGVILGFIVLMSGSISAERLQLESDNLIINSYSEGDSWIYYEFSGMIDGKKISYLNVSCIDWIGSVGDISLALNEKVYEGSLLGDCMWTATENNTYVSERFLFGIVLLNSLQDNSTIQGFLTITINYNQSQDTNKSITFDLFYDKEIDYSQNISSLEQKQNQQNQQISVLETWKQTISNIISSIQTTITTITNTLTNHEQRISNLEVKCNGASSDYFKYLSASDKKLIVCGYSKENHLTNEINLGLNCTTKYTSSQRYNYTSKSYYQYETSSCSCKTFA
jgi:hypothetical protein